jgi:hypothetical protein
MNTAWLSGSKTQEERDKIKKMIGGSIFALDKLSEICYTKVTELESVSRSDYSSAGWAYEQAHRNGEVAALKSIIKLIQERT